MNPIKSQLENINGILLLDKPKGITSNRALQQVKKIFKAKKAGHSGSLDPIASGLLGIFLGKATKCSEYLLESDKYYLVTAKLGERTNTSDADGEIIATQVVPMLNLKLIEIVLDKFRGITKQIPSMFSALKYKGKPLYYYARQNINIIRNSREIQIYKLKCLNFTDDTIELAVHCSKGTYIRTLVDDIGQILGCGAHVVELRRIRMGPFDTSNMVSLEDLAIAEYTELSKLLLPASSALEAFPEVILTNDSVYYIKKGQPVWVPKSPTSGLVKLVDEAGKLIAIGKVLANGSIGPKKLLTEN